MAHLSHAGTLAQRLRAANLQPTPQRLAIAQVLLPQSIHMSADEVLTAARRLLPSLSRATVYNTLPAMVQCGLLRALHVESNRTLYDSRTEPHWHLYDEDSGQLQDLSAGPAVQQPSLPALPPSVAISGVDLIVRVRQQSTPAPHTLSNA